MEGLTGSIAAAHFHNAAAGTDGGVVRTISGDFTGNTASGLWTGTDSEPLTDALIAELLAGNLYVNIHTAANGAGEIRGQVGVPIPVILGIDEGDFNDHLPIKFILRQNYPNPFNPSTTLRFELPATTDISIVVYDLQGREVLRLADQRLEAGYHQLVWNGLDNAGRPVPSGVYIARLVTPRSSKSIKMVLLK